MKVYVLFRKRKIRKSSIFEKKDGMKNIIKNNKKYQKIKKNAKQEVT